MHKKIDWAQITQRMGWQSERQMHIYHYCHQGMSAKQMGDAYGVNHRTVNSRLNALGFPKHSRGHRQGMEISREMVMWLKDQGHKNNGHWPREAYVNNHHRAGTVPDYQEVKL